jgi:hypothetical protein
MGAAPEPPAAKPKPKTTRPRLTQIRRPVPGAPPRLPALQMPAVA